MEDKALNDVEVAVHSPALDQLLKGGVDRVLSRHVAHLLSRDPLLVFNDRLDVEDTTVTEHFEQLQSTNWGNVRFKPPPSLQPRGIGWRVEFRSPEVQVTDLENAAVVSVLRLLAEVIVEERWDLRIPISRCDMNDIVSSTRNAASDGLFWFRAGDLREPGNISHSAVNQQPLTEILSGEHGVFTRCRAWLGARHENGDCSLDVVERLDAYMTLFERRAKGELPTAAALFRERLKQHPAYCGDGVVPEAFVHDMCVFAVEANEPGKEPEELLGDLRHTVNSSTTSWFSDSDMLCLGRQVPGSDQRLSPGACVLH